MRVGIIGSGGFIGGAIAQRLHRESSSAVRCFVHSQNGVPRLTAHGLVAEMLDATDLAACLSAFQDLDVVIAATLGDAASITKSAQVLTEVLRKRPSLRAVYLSTADVYAAQSEICREDAPLAIGSPDWYVAAKISAERTLDNDNSVRERVAVLRPGIVYGSFCFPWTIRVARRISSGNRFIEERHKSSKCNAIYVEDLCELIVLGLSRTGFFGDTWNCVRETVSWSYFFELHAQAIGIDVNSCNQSRKGLKASILAAVRTPLKNGVKRWPALFKFLYYKTALGRRFVAAAEKELLSVCDSMELAAYSNQTSVSGSKAITELGWTRSGSLGTTIAESVAFCRRYSLI